MKPKDIAIILIFVLISAALLTGAYLQLDNLGRARVKMGLVATASPEDMPPSLAFATVAMGAFRGLVVDILWMRADQLKQDGLFFDAKQLAEWITALQPRFAAVWDFHAWNMAYNISVAIPASQCQERWRWVKNGYELLRDKGIPINPKSILLYRQLSWIFLHKIGEVSDDCHRFYKREMAMSLSPLLGPNTNEYFAELIAAPRTPVELASDKEVASLLEQLKQADPAFEQQEKFVDNYLSIRQSPDRFSRAAAALIEQYKGSDALKKVDLFSHASKLRSEWKMDVDFMDKLNREYGPVSYDDPNEREPLNWLHPAAHAIYWSAKGLEVAGRAETYQLDEKNTDRTVFHSLQQLYRTGKIILYRTTDGQTSVFLRPDVSMYDSCDRIWLKAIDKYEHLQKGNAKGLYTGHKNFLENVVMSLYQVGHTEKAKEIFDRLGKLYPVDDYGVTRKEYKGSLISFIKDRMKDEFEGLGLNDATEAIVFTLEEGYFRYAIHDDDEAGGRENIAKQMYEYYQSKIAAGATVKDRLDLPTMDMLRYSAFMEFLNDRNYPEELGRSLMGRIKIEKPELFEKLRKQEDILMERLRKKQQQPGSLY